MKRYILGFLTFAAIMLSASLPSVKAQAYPFYWINYYWSVQDCANAAGSLGYPYYQVQAWTCNNPNGGTAPCLACWGSYN